MFNTRIGKFNLIVACTAFVMIAAGTAAAQNHVYVSAVNGVDTNPCTLAAPCREVQRGIDALPFFGGTVSIVSSGDYGPITIAKTTNVVADRGVRAQLSRVVISSENSNIEVRLKGLAFYRVDGVPIVTVSSPVTGVDIEDCEFISHGSGTNDNGIRILGGGNYVIINSTFTGFFKAIFVATNAPQLAQVHVARSLIKGGGIMARDGSRMTITDSSFVQGNEGLVAETGSRINVDRSNFSHNGVGISVDGGIVRLSDSTVTHNVNFGIRTVNLGRVFSYGNNRIAHNGENISGTFQPMTLQ